MMIVTFPVLCVLKGRYRNWDLIIALMATSELDD